MSAENTFDLPEQEIKKTWHIFPTGNSSTLELRAIWPKGVDPVTSAETCRFTAAKYRAVGERQAAFESEALRLNRLGYNVYLVMNPIRADFTGKNARDEHIEMRRVLLIDIDRVGDTKRPANDAELEAARLLADEVVEWLRERGWGEPHRVMSGNGHHLYYSLKHLPNDERSREAVRKALLSLAARFDNSTVKIDTGVYNASRITKVPGTIARKGQESVARPYRMAVIYEA